MPTEDQCLNAVESAAAAIASRGGEPDQVAIATLAGLTLIAEAVEAPMSQGLKEVRAAYELEAIRQPTNYGVATVVKRGEVYDVTVTLPRSAGTVKGTVKLVDKQDALPKWELSTSLELGDATVRDIEIALSEEHDRIPFEQIIDRIQTRIQTGIRG